MHARRLARLLPSSALKRPLPCARTHALRLPNTRAQSSYRSPQSYWRDFVASVRAVPTPVKAIISANVLVFLAYHLYGNSSAARRFFRQHFVLSRPNIRRGFYDSLIGSMFMHRGLLHLGLNMFTLGSFGPLVMAFLGPGQFLGLYIGTGLVGAASQLAYVSWAPRARIPASPWVRSDSESIGASGAISGLLGYAFTRLPSLEVQVFFVPVRAAILGPVALAASAYFLWAPGEQSIGHADHMGGFLAGAAAALLHARAGRYWGRW